ncbi:MAG TPA: hypothetical protein ENJ30_07510 [Desulfobulbaceae bacterium]|nr:hypothetical protein [Desulfobulbaceae bacterium]
MPVCRKRLEEVQPVSWARMRRRVKSESQRLKELLEHTHGRELQESDLRVILRAKSLGFYSWSNTDTPAKIALWLSSQPCLIFWKMMNNGSGSENEINTRYIA